jgi:hypothetical protein
VQGLWWGSASESGWGVNLTQQGATLFATWFTYDTDGTGLWLVMPNGARAGTDAYSGILYRTTGPSYDASSFDASLVTKAAVGTATLTFSDANNGTFTAVVNGVTVAKPITRQVYGATVPTCTAGGSASAANYQDLWWRSNGAESGWGINITHQGDVIFATWFTYDANGKGLWLVASNVVKTGNGTYSGALYRTTGPAFDTSQWDPSQVKVATVGAITLSFSDASNGVLTAVVNGRTIAKPIAREVFAAPASVCS